MSDALAMALKYASIGVHVLPIWWPVFEEGQTEGRCACGNIACPSPAKHPITELVPHGVKEATKDPNIIKRWWTRYANANIAVACGKVIVVCDVDGPPGHKHLEWVLARTGESLESSCMVETGREQGRHHWFKAPRTPVPTHKIDGLELRSNGAYVVAPPSLHISGKRYRWTHPSPHLPELPKALADFALLKLKTPEPKEETATRRNVNAAISTPNSNAAPPAWSENEEDKLWGLLDFVSPEKYDEWVKVGMVVYWLGWGAKGREIWDVWSQQSSKFNPAGQQKAWDSFSRDRPLDAPKVTLGWLYKMALDAGYKYPVNDQIAELNKRFFMLRNIGGKTLIGELIEDKDLDNRKRLNLMSADSFRTFFCNQDLKIGTKTFPLGAAWVVSKQRRQYDTVIIDPTKPEVTPEGNLNLWRGFGVPTDKPGNWYSIQDHIFNVLADRDNKAFEYILRWTAWSIQNPGRMPEVALVFRGGKGAGKGFFANAVAKTFGEHALHIFSQSHLTGNFNGHLRSCLLLYVDEAFWAGDKKGESVLKGLITENVLMIEQKGIDAVQWKNRLHIIMTANSAWVVPASADERRFAVFNANDYYVKRPMERVPYFNHLYHEMGNGGLPAMLYDLKNWDLKDWHPRQVYETEALFQQKRQSMGPIEQWFDVLLDDGALPGFKIPGTTHNPTSKALMEDFMERAPQGSRYTAGEKAIGDFLRSMDCRPMRIRGFRAWQMKPLTELRREWMERYGVRDWKLEEEWV